MIPETRPELLRGKQTLLPLDWLILDAGPLLGQQRGGALLVRLLAAERRRRGGTQAEVAGRMGVSPAYVSKVETGKYGNGRRGRGEPRLSTILRYAAAAGLEQRFVQLAFTVVIAAEFAGPGGINQMVNELRGLTSSPAQMMLTQGR